MTKICEICKRKNDKFVIWINRLINLQNLELCMECDLSFQEQFNLIIQELKEKLNNENK
jgi:hypothetical protein